ncbi:uncharacterized protein DDB_G0283697 isoform X1 [Ricinus communis]|uniref:uncharacterized protein DDB_G0283697 isoform X1 n=1 Tax=Ricinus communis TaxID=3988 RepID=UPI0007726431|nr:uncharacterized protein DDB_G0283697 isoform X1 [Ricinus communis]|eukprot:XP_015572988.1 uncharacterized protein DDB_G0283697 [Ricinus communis]
MGEEEVAVKDKETVKSDTAVDSPEIESQIKDAMRSRVNYFNEQSNSLTFEGVRRLLEKDLGLQEYALDVHKRFVKQCLLQCLDGDNASKDSGETDEKGSRSIKGEATESPEGHESKDHIKEPCSEDEEKTEESPVMGLLTGKKTPKSETDKTLVKEAPTESIIKKALSKRASYIKANSDKVTMAGLRRLLEEDLRLDKHALDPYKKFISAQLDEVLQSSEVSEPKKKSVKTNSQGKASKKMRTEESSDSSGKEMDTEDEDEVKPKKKIAPNKKMINSEGSKKRKRFEKETKVTSKKRVKPTEKVAEDSSDAEDSGNASEDGRSQSSAEKPVKKKEAPTPVYGKRVEHLKSVIKSCGMSVPPVVYKKVKQVPENKREAQLIKELEEILSKEGLSSNPSEKEIKEVRKRKERAKELEGIDMSNIVSSSRRRSATSYVPPPKPKIPVGSDSDEADDTDEDDEDDNDDDNDDDDDEEAENEDDGDNDGDDESQSEEPNAENGDDSD